jgi:hypothetical protein
MKYCRICNSPLINSLNRLHLRDCPLTDEFVESKEPTGQFVSDLEIVQCLGCGCIQNPHDLKYCSYYSDYEYSSALSPHTQCFMARYADAAVRIFSDINCRLPERVIEPGSGDGAQLKYFKDKGCEVLGVEPSESLARFADSLGISTVRSLFDSELLEKLPGNADICISSYTLDHCPDPIDYLLTANGLLIDNGLCLFEIHDLQKIYQRAEYCLLEHEHTIYLTPEKACQLVASCGFEVVDVNPVPDELCRANSLVIVAKKVRSQQKSDLVLPEMHEEDQKYSLSTLQHRIDSLVNRLDTWLNDTNGLVIGYGAGGRGVMTLAQLHSSYKLAALLDSGFDGTSLLTPKTLIPVYGPSDFKRFSNASVLVFSYGYFSEIRSSLAEVGYDPSKIVSLQAFMV